MSIEEILHGSALQEVRQTIQQGQLHERYCHNCIQAERHGRSERNWHNQMNPGFTPTDTTEYFPVLVDIRWNTTCNFSCNYCNEHSSSQWASLKKLSTQSGTRPYYEQVCEYIDQHQTHIKKVALIGGEPLLLKENERLLDAIPEHCQIDIITNLGVDLEHNRIFEKLKQRTNVGWNISIDNIAQRLEYVRYGSNWELIKSNIKKIQATGHKLGIHPLYNIYNATRLSEFVDWAHEQQIPLHWQSLYHPAYLDPLQLGHDVKQLALSELRAVLNKHTLDLGQRGFLQDIENKYNQQSSTVLLTELKNHITEIESKYHTESLGQFEQFWPELASLL